MFHSRTRITLAGTGIAAVLLIAGCSNGDSNTSTPASHAPATGMSDMPGMNHDKPTGATAPTRTDFTDADVSFLEMMYPHHAQAVEMAKLVPGRSQNQQLIALAADVEKAQAPEMRQFTELLGSFGKPAPGAMGHEMPGMMSHDQMSALENATGPEFDRMWMRMMIDHHQGAIDMANTELAQGVNPDAKALAQAIVTAQQAEIQQMRGMLG
ncbi:uncharacterized protein (DUF305 family) [Nocardia transvalensis]|uniref:Uncharacterized protein (DUF305 family) n=1 Tax=Nocardia transvalensis TaxID=37333 RepID=A0A7W9PBJ1_9NOCA|nr:DUF305 domain-containing protein [Nocardia transvalensis]MBB5912638.1 uncharacterized protein (DUF305 family) [Nocardia transvalensis]